MGLELDPAVELPVVGVRELFCLYPSQKEICWAVGASIPLFLRTGRWEVFLQSFPSLCDLIPSPSSPQEVGDRASSSSAPEGAGRREREPSTPPGELRHSCLPKKILAVQDLFWNLSFWGDSLFTSSPKHYVWKGKAAGSCAAFSVNSLYFFSWNTTGKSENPPALQFLPVLPALDYQL